MARPVFDWPELARCAESGKPGSLAAALLSLQAWHQAYGPRLTARDVHADVLAYLKRQAGPTGMGGRKAYSEWELCLLRQHMDMWRPLLMILKRNGGTIEIDRKHWTLRIAPNRRGVFVKLNGNHLPLAFAGIGRGTPGDIAMHLYGVATSRASVTVRDMIYRKKPKP